ncbi:MAG: arylsulfatase [Deltaproteobacteria bacterium]|nr:arylsulfatase [Deltaproteobacteria bacterium]
MKYYIAINLTLLFVSSLLINYGVAEAKDSRPNILIIVTDDMGYSDWGSFGGEIRTPNLDKLTDEGVRVTQFYTAPACSPTRSMLMTGIDHHMVGIGTMGEIIQPNQRGKPGYEGYINDRAVTMTELLRDSGYSTMMAGKWHLGDGIEQDPSRKGFEQSFALLQGGASHFGDEWMLSANYTPIYRENGKRVHLPADSYSSDFYTQKLIDWLKSKKDDRPFFAYLAFTAPHDPLHVPDDWLDKYKGVYDSGYDELSKKRFAKMKKLGIIPKDTIQFQRPPFIPGWDELSPEERKASARAMELYASMIENVDYNLGRLFSVLKELKVYDNTIIIFFSDNGANGLTMADYPNTGQAWVERNSDNRYENLGKRGSRIAVGPGWALASMTPFRMFKAFISEGGIRSPLIISGPRVEYAGEISHVVADTRDVMPTVLDYANIAHPEQYKSRKVLPMQGRSMLPFLSKKAKSIHAPDKVFAFEFLGLRGIRQGDWKATWISHPFGTSEWQLYNLSQDPGETRDISQEQPDRLNKLIELWNQYAEEVGVILPEQPLLKVP